jgi:hypothetical protein
MGRRARPLKVHAVDEPLTRPRCHTRRAVYTVSTWPGSRATCSRCLQMLDADIRSLVRSASPRRAGATA